jgi:hypothetical protein
LKNLVLAPQALKNGFALFLPFSCIVSYAVR